jgi:hypothetical protein
MKEKRQMSSYGQMDGWRLGENLEVMAQTAMSLVKGHICMFIALKGFWNLHVLTTTESFLYLVLLTLVCTAICICVAITHVRCPVLWFCLFIYSIPKSINRSSSNGYKNSQRISNLALCNIEPVTKTDSIESLM